MLRNLLAITQTPAAAPSKPLHEPCPLPVGFWFTIWKLAAKDIRKRPQDNCMMTRLFRRSREHSYKTNHVTCPLQRLLQPDHNVLRS